MHYHPFVTLVVMYYGGMCTIKVGFAIYIGGKEALSTNV